MELVRWLNDSGWQIAADDRHAFAASDRKTGGRQNWVPSRRLESCDVILCVITPGWLVSDFCHHEFSTCAKQGKFVLPVICELSDLGLLPPAIRALPRVDLTQNRMIDYLALKEVLTQAGAKQAGSKIGRTTAAAAGEGNVERKRPFPWPLSNRWIVWMALLVLAVIAAIWLGFRS